MKVSFKRLQNFKCFPIQSQMFNFTVMFNVYFWNMSIVPTYQLALVSTMHENSCIYKTIFVHVDF